MHGVRESTTSLIWISIFPTLHKRIWKSSITHLPYGSAYMMWSNVSRFRYSLNESVYTFAVAFTMNNHIFWYNKSWWCSKPHYSKAWDLKLTKTKQYCSFFRRIQVYKNINQKCRLTLYSVPLPKYFTRKFIFLLRGISCHDTHGVTCGQQNLIKLL